jgi:hypothetical protein
MPSFDGREILIHRWLSSMGSMIFGAARLQRSSHAENRKISDKDPTRDRFVPSKCATLGDLARLADCYAANCLIECDQCRGVAAIDLGQALVAVLICASRPVGDPAGENLGSERRLCTAIISWLNVSSSVDLYGFELRSPVAETQRSTRLSK